MTSPAHPLTEAELAEIERRFRDAMMDSGYARLTALAKDAIPRLLSTVRAQRGALEAAHRAIRDLYYSVGWMDLAHVVPPADGFERLNAGGLAAERLLTAAGYTRARTEFEPPTTLTNKEPTDER